MRFKHMPVGTYKHAKQNTGMKVPAQTYFEATQDLLFIDKQ